MIQLMILCVLLFVLLIISYFFNQSFLSVSFLTSVLFELVVLLSIVNYESIQIEIGIQTVLIIILAIIFMLLGEFFANVRLKKHKQTVKKVYKYYTSIREFNISNMWIIIACVLCIITFFFRIKTLNDFSIMYSIDSGIDNIRTYYTHGAIQTSRFIIWMTYACQVAAYIFITTFLYNLICCNKKNIRLLLPILTYFMVEYSTTGRTGYIKFFCFTFVIATFFYSTKYKRNMRGILKITKIACYSVFFIGLFFWIYGVFVRKVNLSLLDTLNGYLNGGFYGLDSYLKEPWEKNMLFGENIFRNLYSTLNSLGFNFSLENYHLPFYTNGDITSNIYTGFVIPIQDLGILGFLASRFFIGLIYKKVILYIENFSLNEIIEHIFILIIVADLWYPVLNVIIADRYIDYFDFGYLIIIIFYYLFIKLFKKKFILNSNFF